MVAVQRPPDPPRIVRTPGVCGGKPRLDGTRWYTEIVVDYDFNRVRLLFDYPHLSWAQIDAAVAYERLPHRRLGRVIKRARRLTAAWLLGVSIDELESECGL